MLIEEMDVFKLAHYLALEIYKLTEKFPEIERFGMVTQLRRASASVCSNLFEGSFRISIKEYRHFISYARGSCGEIKYQLLLAKDLGYISEETYKDMEEKYNRVSKMLMALYKSLSITKK